MSEVKRSVNLHETRFGAAEYKRNDHVVDAEAGTTIADILSPSYWSFVATKLTDYDRIEVRLETGEWIAELLVVEHGRNWARVKMLQKYDLTTAEASPVTDKFKHHVEYKGPHHKHCVIRDADQEIIHRGVSTKEEAQRWLVEYEDRTMAAA